MYAVQKKKIHVGTLGVFSSNVMAAQLYRHLVILLLGNTDVYTLSVTCVLWYHRDSAICLRRGCQYFVSQRWNQSHWAAAMLPGLLCLSPKQKNLLGVTWVFEWVVGPSLWNLEASGHPRIRSFVDFLLTPIPDDVLMPVPGWDDCLGC